MTFVKGMPQPWLHSGSHHVKHGHYVNGRASRTLQSFVSMKERCSNPNKTQWKDYGGRGIKVCELWSGENGFANFLAEMGERPAGKTLDRYPNGDGNYEPGNCRWATHDEQQTNRRKYKKRV